MKDLGMITENPMTGESIKPRRRRLIKLFRYPKGDKLEEYISKNILTPEMIKKAVKILMKHKIKPDKDGLITITI